MIKNPFINKFVIDLISNQFRVVLCCGDTLKRDGLGRTPFLLRYLDELIEFEELRMNRDTSVELRIPKSGFEREIIVNYPIEDYQSVKQEVSKICDPSLAVVVDRIFEMYSIEQRKSACAL